MGSRSPKLREGTIFWVVRPIEKYGSIGALQQFTQHKINNGERVTAAGRLQCSRLVDVTLRCLQVKNSPPPFDAAFCQNTKHLTTCYIIVVVAHWARGWTSDRGTTPGRGAAA